jgi:predicted phage tail protein
MKMDKRRARYQQAERTTTAEQRVKALRLEVADLRKQLFRAQESARIANEEATARAVSQRQSGEALRERITTLQREFDARGDILFASQVRLERFDLTPLWRIAAQRIAARFGRAA